MTRRHTDPVTFLKNLITRRGKSELYGVFLTGVTIQAEANEEYSYDISQEKVSQLVKKTLTAGDSAEWNRLLVDLRMNGLSLSYPITFKRQSEPVTVFFVVEGTELQSLVFLPMLNVSEFPEEVLYHQRLLREVASFAGKTPTSMRFTIGAATMDWDDLVDQGCAREVDVGY